MMLRTHNVAILLLLACIGCEQKMADQPSYDPLEPSRYFADGQSSRHPVDGTVARGHAQLDWHFETGLSAEAPVPEAPSLDRPDDYVKEFPFPIGMKEMARGREGYMIHCTPCHGRGGSGTGLVVVAGYPKAESHHSERLREAPVGYLFDVVTRGHEAMPSLRRQISVADRWMILAYLRALQFSRHAPLNELPPEIQERFAEKKE